MLLSKCPVNACARLSQIDVDPVYQLRFQELGVRPGASFRVSTRAAFGGVVINIAGTRVAVDRRSAHRIHVELEPAA